MVLTCSDSIVIPTIRDILFLFSHLLHLLRRFFSIVIPSWHDIAYLVFLSLTKFHRNVTGYHRDLGLFFVTFTSFHTIIIQLLIFCNEVLYVITICQRDSNFHWHNNFTSCRPQLHGHQYNYYNSLVVSKLRVMKLTSPLLVATIEWNVYRSLALFPC